MTPIGKGARFLVLTGKCIGREGVVASPVRTRGSWWKVDIGEGEIIEVSPNDIEAGALKRLPDAPAEVDPLFAEIERGIQRAPGYDDTIMGAGGVADEVRNVLDDIEEGENDADWLASHRKAFVEVARLCILGIRRIDR